MYLSIYKTKIRLTHVTNVTYNKCNWRLNISNKKKLNFSNETALLLITTSFIHYYYTAESTSMPASKDSVALHSIYEWPSVKLLTSHDFTRDALAIRVLVQQIS
jgi:hypothetical protein